MKDDNKIRNLEAAGSSQGGTKKPYEKPAFRHERVFETMALSCGKMASTQSGCFYSHKTS
jgi:hypothetical protein